MSLSTPVCLIAVPFTRDGVRRASAQVGGPHCESGGTKAQGAASRDVPIAETREELKGIRVTARLCGLVFRRPMPLGPSHPRGGPEVPSQFIVFPEISSEATPRLAPRLTSVPAHRRTFQDSCSK